MEKNCYDLIQGTRERIIKISIYTHTSAINVHFLTTFYILTSYCLTHRL